MTFLPIVERELRVRARNRATYWSRFAVGLVAVLVWVPQLVWSGPSGTPGAMGPGLLNAVVSAAFLGSCAACLLTADVISSERREGTLGLLLLTRVRAFDVLLGKLGSAGMTSLCALVAFLPMLMIPVLAGGVTGGEALRKGLVLPNTLFLALAAGLWASACGRERFKTARTAFLLVAGIVLVPSLLNLAWASVWPPGPIIELLSPLGTLVSARDASYKASPEQFWVSLVLVQATAWALLVSAGIRLHRGWREEDRATTVSVPGPAAEGRTEPDGPWLSCSWTAPEPGPAGEPVKGAAPAPFRPMGNDVNPIDWLLQRQRGTRAILWTGALVGLAFGLVPTAVFRFARTNPYWTVVMPLELVKSAIEGAVFACAATRFFVEARRTGELELLLTTPFGARQLVSTQWKVLARLLRWPMIVLLAPRLLGTISALALSQAWLGPSPSLFRLQYAISGVLSCANIILGIGAICWLGFWFGLRANGQARAIAWTVGVVTGLPYLFSMLSRMLFSVMGSFSISWRWSLPFLVLRWLPQVVVLVFYAGLIAVARRRLLSGFADAEPGRFDMRYFFSSTVQDARVALRRVRHWTPS
jgi:ABC-type transport system involved in multi-copper enzyme maturation permease subunit